MQVCAGDGQGGIDYPEMIIEKDKTKWNHTII